MNHRTWVRQQTQSLQRHCALDALCFAPWPRLHVCAPPCCASGARNRPRESLRLLGSTWMASASSFTTTTFCSLDTSVRRRTACCPSGRVGRGGVAWRGVGWDGGQGRLNADGALLPHAGERAASCTTRMRASCLKLEPALPDACLSAAYPASLWARGLSHRSKTQRGPPTSRRRRQAPCSPSHSAFKMTTPHPVTPPQAFRVAASARTRPSWPTQAASSGSLSGNRPTRCSCTHPSWRTVQVGSVCWRRPRSPERVAQASCNVAHD